MFATEAIGKDLTNSSTTTATTSMDLLKHPDRFVRRHIGPSSEDVHDMVAALGYSQIAELIDAAVPANIRLQKPLNLPAGRSEFGILNELRSIAAKNQVFRSYIGMGYHDCVTPPVIQRNILENPGWYTQYTPYQAEISQGRLEGLLNFQTMVCDLTGLEIANASLLDEATAAAEAMMMCHRLKHEGGRNTFFVSQNCHPQTIEVVQTRAKALGVEVIIGNHESFAFDGRVFGALVQYADTYGAIHDYSAFVEKAHTAGALVTVATDLLALTLIKPPGEFGADVAVGSAQRFGVPLGYGGPHAAFFATRDEFKRQMPGRLVGVSKDSRDRPALRLSLGTREQHIRREKATSNICTAQALLANMAMAYACYHGPEGLRKIAQRIHALTTILATGLELIGFAVAEIKQPSLPNVRSRKDSTIAVRVSKELKTKLQRVANERGEALAVILREALREYVRSREELMQPEGLPYFDTLTIALGEKLASDIIKIAEAHGMNFRVVDDHTVGISLDEAASANDVAEIWQIFNSDKATNFTVSDFLGDDSRFTIHDSRTSPFLTHPVFNRYHSETEMLRYLKRLESRDLSLTTSMIPLGSCTMKLNASAEMFPVSWPEFSRIHPFAPLRQTKGYQIIFQQLEEWLAEITGFTGFSLQPNAGSQGEYAGLLVIRTYHEHRGESHRNVCLIPTSAHGTNPASAVMAGMRVVAVACDSDGNISVEDLKAKADAHRNDLAALMVTYPSTHGVFEETIKEICQIVHDHGGQVYMDGANLNAQVGLCRPADIGADVCHLNLHKTFCIPHGGGGPGMGPIGVAGHLVEFLPGHPVVNLGGENPIGAVSAAPWGSASILTISWVYIAAMGGAGLTEATKVAILNANYIAKRLEKYFPVLYKGHGNLVAHECILDLRQFKSVTVEDVAKRLMDYGFHAPTVSFPVPGTMMVEPTESESKSELDRFCEAMIAIHGEITAIESGTADKQNNLLKNAPHTADMIASDNWNHPYSREQAAFPAKWLHDHKFWPYVGRIDNVYGDRNLVCSCVGMEAYQD